MLTDQEYVFNTDEWHRNKWDGWDYDPIDNPNLAPVALRVTREDGRWTVIRFNNWHSRIVEWTAEVSSGAPVRVLQAVVDAGLGT